MTDDLTRVLFTLDPDDWHRTPVESLWAKPVVIAGETGAFELDNSPFFARGVSYCDIIRARLRDEVYEFAGVLRHNGHSTYRTVFEEENDATKHWWSKLVDLGCTREWGMCRGMVIFSIDVPPNADILAVYSTLEEAQKEKVWMFEEGHVGHRRQG